MAKKKRCQFQGDEPCTYAVLRIAGDCPYCKADFCATHRLPEHHGCDNIDLCRQAAFDRNKAKLISERTVAAKMATA